MLNDKGDTTICFSVNQSKYLLKKINELNQCDTLRSVCETQLSYCDSVSESNKRIKFTMSEMMKSNRDLVSLYNMQVVNLEKQLQTEITNTNRQKLYKWIAIVVGSVTTGFTTYKWITK